MIPVKINRKLAPGKYPVTEVFKGLEKSPGFKRFMPSKHEGKEFLTKTFVQIVPEDLYMYTDDEDGHVNVGLEYLIKGEAVYLYLDILHEFVHVKQFMEGKELFDRSKQYVDRPTEVEAYQFVVDEARRLGLSDEKIFDYLQVEWISTRQHERLARKLGVNVKSNKTQ